MDQPGIKIDVTREEVVIRGPSGTRTLRGQWVSFYALLALRADGEDDTRLLTVDELRGFDRWAHKARSSVGKEVARHLANLRAAGFGDMVEHRGKTRQWCLATLPSLVPNRTTVARWLDGHRAPPPIPSVGPLGRLVEATLALQAGRTEEAMALAESVVAEGANDAAWRAVVAGRAAQRTDEGERIPELLAEIDGQSGAAMRAARARLEALAIYDQRFIDPARQLPALRRLAGQLENDGDIGSLAAVLNVMGLLARRANRPEEGVSHLRRACSLFGLCGDMSSLQAALFNLALCRVEVLGTGGCDPDDEAMALIDMCLAVCASFGVGRDSAQAEITGCRWALRRGEIERARRYLDDAESIIRVLPSSFEQACFLRARAELALVTSDDAIDPLHALRTAARLFAEAGDATMAKRVERQLALLPKARR